MDATLGVSIGPSIKIFGIGLYFRVFAILVLCIASIKALYSNILGAAGLFGRPLASRVLCQAT